MEGETDKTIMSNDPKWYEENGEIGSSRRVG